MNQEQILRNIADRKAAESVLELAEDMPEAAKAEAVALFRAKLQAALKEIEGL